MLQYDYLFMYIRKKNNMKFYPTTYFDYTRYDLFMYLCL